MSGGASKPPKINTDILDKRNTVRCMMVYAVTAELGPGFHFEFWRKTIIEVDPRYFRPTAVDLLLGDPYKAREKLGWVPRIDLDWGLKLTIPYFKSELMK